MICIELNANSLPWPTRLQDLVFACLPHLILGQFPPAFLTSSHCFSDSCWNAFFVFCLGALKTVKKKLQLKWSGEARRGRSHALGQQWQSPPERRNFLFLPGKSSDNKRPPQPSQEKVTILPTPNPEALQIWAGVLPPRRGLLTILYKICPSSYTSLPQVCVSFSEFFVLCHCVLVHLLVFLSASFVSL